MYLFFSASCYFNGKLIIAVLCFELDVILAVCDAKKKRCFYLLRHRLNEIHIRNKEIQ